jgi:hypothetical protein
MAGVQHAPRHISLDLAPEADSDLHTSPQFMIKPTPTVSTRAPVTYTVCGRPVCGQKGFCRIRLHRRSKGRPDSLVNPILLQQPCAVGRRSVSTDPTLLRAFSLGHLSSVWLPGLPELPTKSSSRPAREMAEESPACLEHARAVASLGLPFLRHCTQGRTRPPPFAFSVCCKRAPASSCIT